MSFSSDVKEEVARNIVNEKCQKARLAAIIKLLASVGLSSNGMYLTLKSKNAITIKMVALSINTLYNVKCGLKAIKQPRFDQTNLYEVIIREKCTEILEDLDLYRDGFLQDNPRMKFFTSEGMLKNYLSGCFLATGSINSPVSPRYHLEMSTNSEQHAHFIQVLLNKFDLESNVTIRRNKYVVYIKRAEYISEFLRIMEANNSLFSFEDVRIERDYVANIARLDNIDIANEVKVVAASGKQIEAIEFLKRTNRLSRLSEKDQDIALLRLENPDCSLLELATIYRQMSGVELSKSGMRHRFVKILELAEKYMNKGEKQ